MLEAKISVTLKKTVADPQGQTVKHALDSLGYTDVEEVRIGKLVTVRMNTSDREIAKNRLNEMCKALISNPIIEDYSFELKDIS